MNIRSITTLAMIACAPLAGTLLPAQPALAEKPARIEARQEGEDLREAPRTRRGASGQPQRGRGAAPAPAPAARQDPPVARGGRGGAGPAGPSPGRPDDRSGGRDRRDDRDHGDRGDRRPDPAPSAYRPRWQDDGASASRQRDWRYDGGSRYRYADASHRHRYDLPRHHYPARRYYYPPRGYVYPALPRNVVVVRHRHHHYWYGGGVWYRPHGTRYIVVAPPVGVFVSVLPSFYSTYWFGGVPYYYANDAYYLWRDSQRAYEVVAPPAGAGTASVDPVTEDLFVYPAQGQSEEQTAFDRYECHRWAAEETGFDPTQPWGGVAEDRAGALREAYLRAMTACLEGRGYTVR